MDVGHVRQPKESQVEHELSQGSHTLVFVLKYLEIGQQVVIPEAQVRQPVASQVAQVE